MDLGTVLIDCPRCCKGQLLPELLEQNLWTCLLCARHYMRLNGEMIEIRRPPNPGEAAERAPGTKAWREMPRKR